MKLERPPEHLGTKVYARDESKNPRSGGTCIRPARLPDGRLMPCGRCTSCVARQRHQKVRAVQQEIAARGSCYFVTFTYSDAALRQYAMAPYKPEGQLGPLAQAHVDKVSRRIRRWERERDGEKSDARRESLTKRIHYNRGRLVTFKKGALPLQPDRMTCRWLEAKAQRERERVWLRAQGYEGDPGRRAMKQEYGGKRGRPHFHALYFGADPIQLEAVIRSWGPVFTPMRVRLALEQGREITPNVLKEWKPPPIPNWQELVFIDGRGFVDVQVADNAKIGSYVSKDMYRGEEHAAWEYLVKEIEPPRAGWPKNPPLGGDGWMELLQSRWRTAVKRGYSPADLELYIQDTERRGLRYRNMGSRSHGDGEATHELQQCPPTLWQRFLDSIESERDRDARVAVAEYLKQRRAAQDSAPGMYGMREMVACQSVYRQLGNFRKICRQKGIEFPETAAREEEYVLKRLVQLRGGQVANLATGLDVESVPPPVWEQHPTEE